jgi:hypothetical protein
MVLTWFAGKDVQWWAAVLGMAFIGVQLVHKLWAWRNEWVDRRAARRGRIPTKR